ncbi:hypothetical protein FQN60_001058 [Etheostoma spectabile]|uniref:Uncharacterized protein n=1 Tax=Etheostoma spectabile TaxID=54343 RepID=A0A5J5C804_9PERO|nr:hypothetical protein FQN60_001058 [Etheostoma spectabile]
MNSMQHVTVLLERGNSGRPRVILSEEYVSELLNMGLSVKCIAKLVGVSRWTLQRRMNEWGLSVRGLYSDLTDDELDILVSAIHSSSPNAGYRMMMGLLRAQGHRVQWQRIRASMHRVDTVGIVSRMAELRSAHLFCCHYVFIPRLQAQLDVFTDGWDNHPLSTERNLTPNQLWYMGLQQNSEEYNDEDLHIPLIDWESSGLIPSDLNCGIHVPESDCPLRPDELAGLCAAVDPMGPSICMGVDKYLAALEYMHSIGYE